MKVEFVLDKNCLSVELYLKIFDGLAEEFTDHEFKMTMFDSREQRFRNSGVWLLPAWIIDNELQGIDPGDFSAIRKQILLRISRESHE